MSRHGMVVSQREVASQVGAAILDEGGNAIDAAVATGFALAVVLPRAGNLGGGFMLVHLAQSGETHAIDYREMAPKAAHRDLFLDADGNVDTRLARYSLLSAGVPGTVAGLTHALDQWGTMPLAKVMAPAVNLARRGFVVGWDLSENLRSRQDRLTRNPETARLLFRPDGSAPEPGTHLVQKDLARSLSRIARQGPKAFYEGRIAESIVTAMAAGGGIMTLADLAAYRVANRKPVRGIYRGFEVISMPPPSSGGVHIIQMLNVLHHFPVAATGAGSNQNIHWLAEVMKLAYADRSQYLGDPDYFDVPVARLTGKAYAAQLAATIKPGRARPAVDIRPGLPVPVESPDTTHFSVADRFGNVVSNTYTLNFSYGSGIAIPGAGFLMNNEMDDFSAKPGVPNGFGLLGGEANAIEPGKRPLSSMTPTIVLKDGKPWLVTGSPGGSRIISTVLQFLVNVIDHQLNVAEATARARVHHQWLPDQLELEPGFSSDVITSLEAKGHNVKVGGTQGSLQSLAIKDGIIRGAADPRRPGAGAVAAVPR